MNGLEIFPFSTASRPFWSPPSLIINTRLFKMIVGVLTTCHTQYTWDRSTRIFLFNRTTLQVFVTYLTGALYVHPLWFYKHQHDNRVHSKLFVACQQWWFHWRFWFVPSVLGYLREEGDHKPDPWHNPIERNHLGLHVENEVARQVTSDHHRSHARSIAVVNAGLKILWRVCGNGAGLHPFAIRNQHCPRSVQLYTPISSVVYDKLLKPWQSFLITLYFGFMEWMIMCMYVLYVYRIFCLPVSYPKS